MMQPVTKELVHGSSRERPELSIVIPAYNEGDTISATLQKISEAASKAVESFEIVVVDDGSTDDTYRRLRSLAKENPSVVAVRIPINRGKGNAVKKAAEKVRGGAVIVMDGDLDIDPSHVRQYVEALRNYDICIASKRHPDSVYRAPLMRKFLSVSFNKTMRLLTGIRFTDSQTGLKAMRGEHFRRIMGVISVKRYAYDVEILAVADLLRLRVAEFPVKIEQTSAFSKRAIMYMIVDLLGIVYRLRVLKWYQKNLNNPSLSYKPVIPI